MTLLLASARGRGSFSIGAGTAHLHGRVWLYRVGGVGVAQGKAEISCQTKSAVGTGSDFEWFKFQINPNGRQEVWRHSGGECTITVSLKGRGLLNVALRGY